MKFGLFGGARVAPVESTSTVEGDSLGLDHFIDYVRTADQLGFSHIFMVEHHFTGREQVSSSLSVLTYLAGITKTIRLGTGVVVLPWHNPALLAESVAALDLLSGGRFDFGIGRGYRPGEFKGFGLPFGEASERFEEAFAFLRRALTTADRFSYAGKHWSFEDVLVEPRPIQRPGPPFWMAGSSPDSIRRAAREGVNLLLDQVGSIDLTIRRLDIYREEKLRLGLPYDSSQVAISRGLRLTDTEKDRQAAIEEMAGLLESGGAIKWGESQEDPRSVYVNGDAHLIGSIDLISERIGRLKAAGAEIILLADFSGNRSTLTTLAEQVFPQFQGSAAIGRAGAERSGVSVQAARA